MQRSFLVLIMVCLQIINLPLSIQEQLITSEKYQLLTDNSFASCLKVKRCMSVFEQTEYNNKTIFEYFIRPFIIAKSKDVISTCLQLMDEGDDKICAGLFDIVKDADDNTLKPQLFVVPVLERLWIYELILYKQHIQVCDINHHLVIDKDSLKGVCVCNFDSLCENATTDRKISLAIIIIILVILFLMFIQYIYKLVQLTSVIKTFFREMYATKRMRFSQHELEQQSHNQQYISNTTEREYKLLYIKHILNVLVESI